MPCWCLGWGFRGGGVGEITCFLCKVLNVENDLGLWRLEVAESAVADSAEFSLGKEHTELDCCV